MKYEMKSFIFWTSILQATCSSYSACAEWNNCNGHGYCDTKNSRCVCYEGWGASTDITLYRSPDCSEQTCPHDISWGALPTDPYSAHPDAECSDAGICDRSTGLCNCVVGYWGSACQKRSCPNDCSGHGRCLSLRLLSRQSDALPLSPNSIYFARGNSTQRIWDQDKIFACVCDSSWSVGLNAGQRQEPEWFGSDCSQRHCPSGDNPNTVKNETDCYNVTAAGSHYKGNPGNLCHVDCSNLGKCDYNTGLCKCFNGYYGSNCGINNALASSTLSYDTTISTWVPEGIAYV